MFNHSAGILNSIPPIFNEAASGIRKSIKIARKGWAVVRWVFNDPSACRIRGDTNNKVITRRRRLWKQRHEAMRYSYTLQNNL